MRDVVKKILEAHVICLNERVNYDQSVTRRVVDNDLEARFLVLFSHWFNDIVSLAAHYGFEVVRVRADGSEYRLDGTVDTLIAEYDHVRLREDVPAAPSEDAYWHNGEWKTWTDISEELN